MSLSIKLIAEDLYRMFGIEATSDVPDFAKQEVLQAINGAMQIIQTSPDPHFTQVAEELEFDSGDTRIPMSSRVLQVIGPVYTTDQEGRPVDYLTPCRDRFSFDRFADLYQADGQTPDYAPVFYWLDRKRQTGDNPPATDNPSSVTLNVAPAPTDAITIMAWVKYTPTTYGLSDLASTTKVPTIPGPFVETIMLPIARNRLTTSRYFARPEQLNQIAADYQTALMLLGITDPDTPDSRDRKPEGPQ